MEVKCSEVHMTFFGLFGGGALLRKKKKRNRTGQEDKRSHLVAFQIQFMLHCLYYHVTG